ncbi:MAG: MMPL family transporter [Lachnospiraceae bacterium]|nr:MMPL family transporter [Lachnospiraceae bacterium]
MKNFGRNVVRFRIPILIICLILLIPSAIGYVKTRVNYDILYYLPDEIETMKGQDVLLKDFGKGAYALFICENMNYRDVAKVKKNIEAVEHVAEVLWYDSVADVTFPLEMLPDKVRDFFNSEHATMMAIFFDTTTSADETMRAVDDIRQVAGKQCFLSGMSAIVTDTKNMVEDELFTYVAIAAGLALLVMAITMDSFLIPILFLLSIGMAIVYNMGTNFLKGEISFITMALAAVLQLAVTMDYSIFLYESYKEQKKQCDDRREAMAKAINATLNSVVGSSLTTVAGFVALCFMSFTLGADLGIVMAKGVVIGVICCVTLLPSMILTFDRLIEKTSHRTLNLKFDRLSKAVLKLYPVFAVLMVLLWIPSLYGYKNMDVYYKLDASLPSYLPSVTANQKLSENFRTNTIHMVLVDSGLDKKTVSAMSEELERTPGVVNVLGLDALTGVRVPDEIIPEQLSSKLVSKNEQLLLITSEYQTATDEVNAQVDTLSSIVKRYDQGGMVIGEAAATKDLISITDHDFAVVNAVSIGMIFILIALVLKSAILPILLVFLIELAIYINLGLCFFTGSTQSFIASVVIGTIQLGATVDYAILMTNRYKTERIAGMDKKEAALTALCASAPSIITSALGFFAATIGVGIYSDVDLISSLCILMGRGAIISMVLVLLCLPSLYMVFDGLIIRTTKGMEDCVSEARSHLRTRKV